MTFAHRPNTKNTLTLVFLFLLFIGPALGSWILFNYFQTSSLPKMNKGQLIPPLHSLTDFAFTEVDSDLWRGKWGVFFIPPSECEAFCLKQIDSLNHIQQLLVKDASRVTFMLARSGDTPFNHKTHHFLQVQVNKKPALSEIIRDPHSSQFGEIYIFDPLENLVLYYPGNASVKDILQDVKRLLRVSQIG